MIQNFSIKSTVRFLNREYQLRSSKDGQLNKIVCSLFRNGNFINSIEFEYDKEPERDILSLIKNFHEQRKSEIEHFFNLSDKLDQIGSSELQNMLGLIFVKNNLHSEAIREFKRAISRNPTDSWAYNNLGNSLYALKKYKLAINIFMKAIELSPNYADFYHNLGLIYMDMGSCKNAMKQFDKAIELNPYYADAHFNLGLTYILNQITREDFSLTNNYKEKVYSCFEKATLMNPGYQNKYYYTGLGYLKDDKLEEAFDDLKIAKNQGKNFSYLVEKYDFYLKILFYNEDDSYEMIWKYIKFLQALLKKHPGHADVYNDLGLAYCMLRNHINKRAIKNFENALKINPNFETAKRNLKLSTYEKTGSDIFLKAITYKKNDNGSISSKNNRKLITSAIQDI